MTTLSELTKKQAVDPPPADAAHVAMPSPDERRIEVRKSLVERVEVDVVLGGVLMKITFAAGMDPSGVLPYLRSLDPGCKVRDDFPSKSFGGKRERLRARLLVITLKASDNGLFIDLVCRGESDLSVKVSKKKAGEFRGLLAGTGQVSEAHLETIDGAIASKGTATVVLGGEESVEVEYWTADDGAAFLENLHPVKD